LIRCPEPGHAPTRSLARCSATERLEPSRPGRATGPSLRSPGGAHGVQRPFAGLFPPAGDRSSLIERAHVLFAPASSARFILIGLIAPLANTKMRANVRAVIRDDVSGQLLGFNSRLRSVSGASFCSPRIDPALGFASCRVSGTQRTCIRMGSTPSESSVSEPGNDARSAVVASRALSAHGVFGCRRSCGVTADRSLQRIKRPLPRRFQRVSRLA
jgi:hypothetical protein